jgi:hypothetical protein
MVYLKENENSNSVRVRQRRQDDFRDLPLLEYNLLTDFVNLGRRQVSLGFGEKNEMLEAK